MHRLTVNQVAFGSIKRRRGQYKMIILSAGLAIFFVSALFLFVQSIYETQRLSHISRVGNQDAVMYDCERDELQWFSDITYATPENLLEGGNVAAVGSLYVIAETEEGQCPIGYYDEPGAELANVVVSQGRLPENIGEIAIEPNFLLKMRMEAKVGEDIELKLKFPLGTQRQFSETSVTKTYRIVGILKPRSSNITTYYFSDRQYMKYPTAIVSNKELIEAGGREIVHRLVKFAPGVMPVEFEKYAESEYFALGLSITAFNFFSAQSSDDNGTGMVMAVIAALLGGVLILSACLGIVNALSGNLSQRRSQIGMMRAVGATSRQIRSIFGREAILLASLIAPLSIALSYLFVWGLCRLTGIVSFHTNLWFLPVIFLSALTCVSLASFAPLLSASRLPPMHAIREVSLLRARKRIRIKEKAQYDAPRLIAGRHLRLYKTRQMGVLMMVALSILMLSMAIPFVANMWGSYEDYDYRLHGFSYGSDHFVETDVTPYEGLRDEDVAEIKSLPLVTSVETARSVQINLLMDEVMPYAAKSTGVEYYWMEVRHDIAEETIQDYKDFKAEYGLVQEIVPNRLFALDSRLVENLQAHILTGEIDIEAINAGHEVLMFVPEVLYEFESVTPDGFQYDEISYWQPWDGQQYKSYVNDDIFVGDHLSILRLFSRGTLPVKDVWYHDRSDGVTREQAETKIGALIGKDLDGLFSKLNFYSVDAMSLITTHEGLMQMGFEAKGYFDVCIKLASEPDDETHKYLTDQLKAIAARGEMDLWNNVQNAKDGAFWQVVFKISMMAVLLLMLLMCVSLVNSAITNRLRSEKRAIGTLRAVGAALSDIVASYRLQALSMIGWGVLLGAILSAVYFVWYLRTGYIGLDVPLGILLISHGVFLGAVALLCGVNLSLRVREITRDSITQNIREL